jgi:hypothetical protein
LWGDRGCDYFTFRHNVSANNQRAGIRWEIGANIATHVQHAEAYCNRLFGNGDGNPDRAGLVVNSANGMEAHDNDCGPNAGAFPRSNVVFARTYLRWNVRLNIGGDYAPNRGYYWHGRL